MAYWALFIEKLDFHRSCSHVFPLQHRFFTILRSLHSTLCTLLDERTSRIRLTSVIPLSFFSSLVSSLSPLRPHLQPPLLDSNHPSSPFPPQHGIRFIPFLFNPLISFSSTPSSLSPQTPPLFLLNPLISFPSNPSSLSPQLPSLFLLNPLISSSSNPSSLSP